MSEKGKATGPQGPIVEGETVVVHWTPGVPESYELDGCLGVVVKLKWSRSGREVVARVDIVSKDESKRGEKPLPLDALRKAAK